MKIRPAILELLHAYKWTSPEMTFGKDDDVITHAQMTGNGVLIVPHKVFEHPPCWCNQLYEIKKYCCGQGSTGMSSKPNVMKISPSAPETVIRKVANMYQDDHLG
jgi:hypothetical protein